MDKTLNLVGRVLLAQIFLLSGLTKITGFAGTQGYMEAMGVPGVLLPLVIAVEVGGGLALLLGWQTRWASLALAGFSIVSAALFHANFTDQMQTIMFMKNLAMAGGLLILATSPVSDTWSLDARRG
ncbi:MAG: DoxX family protein [Gammaproteobacteria bacterium]|nr:DoxX family protein [Gammaproteobacteria bacterium]